MEYERKQKIKKGVLIGYISITTIFTIFMIIMLAIAGVSSKKKQKASAYVQDSYYVSETYKGKIQPKYVSYDDEEYKITLTADELNNYHWEEFYNTFTAYNDSEDDYNYNLYDITFTYGGVNYVFDSVVEGTVEFSYSDYVIQLGDFNYKFNYFDNGLGDDLTFESSATMNIYSTFYDEIKTAIELDIQANNPPSFTDGIFETLTDSVVAFIGSLSSGITAMVSVFWSNDSLTVIGTLSVIVVAVSLAYFLFRLIIGLIRMRG